MPADKGKQSGGKLTVVTTASSNLRDDGTRAVIEQGVPIDKLKNSFTRFLSSMQQIIDVSEGRVGDFVLDEITFSAEVGADGEFKLLGSGIGMSASTGVSFTLRRQPATDMKIGGV